MLQHIWQRRQREQISQVGVKRGRGGGRGSRL